MKNGVSMLGAGRLVLWVGVFVVSGACGGPARAADPDVARGRELFNREWTGNDDRSHGGDGLGPVYNDSSCVACHNAGGVGGGGPSSKNVDIVTAFLNRGQVVDQGVVPQPSGRGFLMEALASLIGLDEPAPPTLPVAPVKPGKVDTTELVKAHAGFKTARSVVLHRFGTDPKYDLWREGLLGMVPMMAEATNVPPPLEFNDIQAVTVTVTAPGVDLAQTAIANIRNSIQNRQFQSQGQAGEFALLHSQRNPTALFGAGLLDSVPNSAIEAAAQVRSERFPEIAGRVAKQKDGRIGRFGWKAQTPSLNDFVLTACAVELGLEVPEHHQGGLPQKPDVKAKGLDLDQAECAALVAFVTKLPRPIEDLAGTVRARESAAGKALFEKVGCANCHTPKLGDVDGLYSDLLLHDLGPDLGDVGAYSVFDPNSSDPEFVDPDEPMAANGPQDEPVAVFATSPFDTPTQAAVAFNPTEAPPVRRSVLLAEATFPSVTTGSIVTRTLVGFATMMGLNTVENQRQLLGLAQRPAHGPAGRQEWKTPPLWGLRDSSPYLHDGRAETLEQAIALHGGEATNVTTGYFKLKPEERVQMQTFLKSLVAPTGDR